jgi:Flp pilus assembly protein TadG
VSFKRKPIKRENKQERGSTLVEFTLTLLPLLALLMLTLDLGWVLFGWASIQEAVRTGVRFAITCQSDANIINAVQHGSLGFINSSNSALVSVHYYSPTNPTQEIKTSTRNSPGNIVKVVISGVSIGSMAPIWRTGTPLSLSASSIDVVEPNDSCPTP